MADATAASTTTTLDKMLTEHYDEEDDEDYEQESRKTRKRVIDDDASHSSSASSSSSSEDDDDEPVQLKAKSKRIQKQQEQNEQLQAAEDAKDQQEEQDKAKMGAFERAQLALKQAKAAKKVELSVSQKADLVEATLKEMDLAYERDVAYRRERKPAVEKLKHLESVMVNLGNQALATTFVEYGVGNQIVLWLKPTRKHLPNLRIRTELIKACDHLPFERHETALKDSKLGKMLNYYASSNDEVFENRTLANKIVKRWMDYLKTQKL